MLDVEYSEESGELWVCAATRKSGDGRMGLVLVLRPEDGDETHIIQRMDEIKREGYNKASESTNIDRHD